SRARKYSDRKYDTEIIQYNKEVNMSGSPGHKRQHQAAYGNIPYNIQTSCHPERGLHSQEEHADIADQQHRRTQDKNLFDPHAVGHFLRSGNFLYVDM